MAIFDISHVDQKEESKEQKLTGEIAQEETTFASNLQPASKVKDRFLSSFFARLFFLALLCVDVLWLVYSICKIVLFGVLSLCFFPKKDLWERVISRACLSFRRALVCALALFVALISPGFGIMIACTYFLMYDKQGVEEVVPSSLQEQFQEFFNNRS